MSTMTVTADRFPRPLVLAAAALILFSLGAALIGRLADEPDPGAGAPVLPTAATRELQFIDLADGTLRVVDARTGAGIAEVAPGTGGFVRGLMRALARLRMVHEAGTETPFQLGVGSDGRLVLTDPATDSRIDLDAFGPTNAAAFAALLNATLQEDLP